MTTDKLPEKRAVAASAIWYTLASFLTKALGYITIPIFTRLMTPAEFGDFNAFAAMQVFLVALLGFEAFLTLSRARFDVNRSELYRYQFTLLLMTAIIGGIVLVALLVWPALFESLTDLDRQYLLIMVLYAMFFPAFNMFQAYQRVQYRYKLSASIAMGVSLLATGAAVVLVVMMSDALMGRIVGQYIPVVVVGLGFFVFYGIRARGVRVEYLKYALPLCVPLIVATIGTQGLVLGSRLVVQQMGRSEEVGYVAIGTSIANIALILIAALNNAWAPWLMDCLQRNKIREVRSSFTPFLIFVVVLAISASMLAPELVLFLGGEAYLPAVDLVPSFMASAVLTMIANQYIFVQTFHKSIFIGGILTLLVAAINVVICVFTVKEWGFTTVGYVAVGCYVILIFAQKMAVRRFPHDELFPWSLIGLPVALVLCLVPLELWLFTTSLSWLRYCAVGLGAALSVVLVVRIIRKRRVPQIR